MAIISWSTIFFALLALGFILAINKHNRYIAISFFNITFASIYLGWAATSLLLITGINFYIIQNKNYTKKVRLLLFGVIITLLPFFIIQFGQGSLINKLLSFLAIGFFSLQQIGALIDVYFERAPQPKNIFIWTAFSMFFPNLSTGPITRWQDLSQQLLNPATFTKKRGNKALWLLMVGTFKKMAIAIPLMHITDVYFENPKIYGFYIIFVVAPLFRYAIWADLSAHTDWARGVSHMFGIELQDNFRRPFQSLSLADFWRRWHMSLSKWLQDYVFIPLSFSSLRKYFSPRAVLVISLLATFGVFGLWHGITLSLLFMGIYKGVGVILNEWLHQSFLKDLKESKYNYGIKIAVQSFFLMIFVFLPSLLLKLSLNEIWQILSTFPEVLIYGDLRWHGAIDVLTQSNPKLEVLQIYILAFAIAFIEVIQFLNRSNINFDFSFELTSSPKMNQLFWPVSAITIFVLLWIFLGQFQEGIEFSYGRI